MSSISVINASVWPKYKEFNTINISPAFTELQQKFEKYYQNSHSGYNFRYLLLGFLKITEMEQLVLLSDDLIPR
jgi:hypothetical protein